MAWLSDAVYTKELGVVYNLAPYAYKVTVKFCSHILTESRDRERVVV